MTALEGTRTSKDSNRDKDRSRGSDKHKHNSSGSIKNAIALHEACISGAVPDIAVGRDLLENPNPHPAIGHLSDDEDEDDGNEGDEGDDDE